MRTETIKVKREVEETWKMVADAVLRCVHIGGPGYGFRFEGIWSIVGKEPSEVRAAAERLWETIRPLLSGTSPDGSPWGEVRIEGEAPVRCFWDWRSEEWVPTVRADGEDFRALLTRFVDGSGASPFWTNYPWAPLAAAWFKDHPWTGEKEKAGLDVVDKLAKALGLHDGYTQRAPEHFRRAAQSVVDEAIGEFSAMRQDRDEFERRAVEAEKKAEKSRTFGFKLQGEISTLKDRLFYVERIIEDSNKEISLLTDQLSAATKHAEEAESAVAKHQQLWADFGALLRGNS